MFKNKEFLARAKKLRLTVDYLPGEKLEQIVKEIVATPQPVIDQFKKVTKPM